MLVIQFYFIFILVWSINSYVDWIRLIKPRANFYQVFYIRYAW
jgi:hypothetical protein